MNKTPADKYRETLTEMNQIMESISKAVHRYQSNMARRANAQKAKKVDGVDATEFRQILNDANKTVHTSPAQRQALVQAEIQKRANRRTE